MEGYKQEMTNPQNRNMMVSDTQCYAYCTMLLCFKHSEYHPIVFIDKSRN